MRTLREQVAAAGLDWAELAAALVSHAHFDHTGAARMLPPDQPLLLQRAEWEHATRSPDPRGDFLFADDLVRPGLSVVLLEGDTPLGSGLHTIDTAGHTPGHQSFVIERTEVWPGHDPEWGPWRDVVDAR